MPWPKGVTPTNAKVSDEDFVAAWRKASGHGPSVQELTGLSASKVFQRRRAIEKKLGILLTTTADAYKEVVHANRAVVSLPISDGTVLVGSDAHIHPGPLTCAQRAFIKFAADRKLLPNLVAIILNGDIFDGASISRFPSIGWERAPTVKEELDAISVFTDQLEKVPGVRKIWTLGNHDARAESRLANAVPQFAGVHGFHLKDHYPAWTPCWRVDINDDVVVKHRWHNGLHGTHSNTLKAGKTVVTGHLHSLKVSPWSDYTGTRFGVDSGTLADTDGAHAIHYTEASPVNWRSGFVVLTFRNGRLMWPEIVCRVDDETVEWRGDFITV